jgi:DNA-binding SARP family transcriptional activator
MKPAIRITLFGKFAVHLGEEVLLDHAPHKAKELLAYLTLHRGKSHPREALAELLWDEQGSSNSRKHLRQALWHLHTGLIAAGRARAAQLLHAESDWLELAIDEHVETDVVQLEQAFAKVSTVRGASLQPGQARSLAEAARRYRGDLLEGWAAEWCAYDRERFRRMYLTILEKLADYYEAHHEYEAAIAYATLSLSKDPARERSHRSLMRALAMSGDRCAAIRQYSLCKGALREEVGVDPEPETVVLEQMIRAGELAGAVREQFSGTKRSGASVLGSELTVLAAPRRVQGGRVRQG